MSKEPNLKTRKRMRVLLDAYCLKNGRAEDASWTYGEVEHFLDWLGLYVEPNGAEEELLVDELMGERFSGDYIKQLEREARYT